MRRREASSGGQRLTMLADAVLFLYRISLPEEVRLPPGIRVPFQWARLHGDRVHVSGHGPLAPDGTPAGPFGKVPGEVSLEDAQVSARLVGLAILASLKSVLGDLDRILAWLTIAGFVNADPGYPHTAPVMNPVSDLILRYSDRRSVATHGRL